MDRRAVERIKLEAQVQCTVGARGEPATAYDISTDGCMVETSNGFVEMGETLRIAFPGGWLAEGIVVWRRHRNAGVQFDGPLSPASVNGIVRAARLSHPSGPVSARESVPFAPIPWPMAGPLLAARAGSVQSLYYVWCTAVLATCAAELIYR